MTGWLIAFGLVIVVAAGVILIGRLPRASWEIVGAALLLGLAGYAWQGSPGLAGSPRSVKEKPAAFDEDLTERRRALADRFGPASQWMILSDGLGRQGKTREAANVLVSGLREYPKDANLWLGLGNALVAHGNGILSPSADYAFRRAIALDPQAPAAPYFYGLALAQSGQFADARKIWGPLADRVPPDSPFASEMRENLRLLDERLSAGGMP